MACKTFSNRQRRIKASIKTAIFTSQSIVIWYLYTIPRQKPLLKVGLPVDWFHKHRIKTNHSETISHWEI